jgi:flagellar hook-basal body complex protein FliE
MEMKDAYKKKFEAQLATWAADIALLESKAEKATGDIRDTLKKEADSIREKQKTASENIKEMEEASGDTWELIKIKADKFWNEIKSSMSSTIKKDN